MRTSCPTSRPAPVRALSYGGAPIAPDLVHRLQAAFPTARVGNGFGLTETSSVSTYLPDEYAAAHADSVGFPAPVVDLQLDEADPETGVGELLIRGPNVVAGYWQKEQQTAEPLPRNPGGKVLKPPLREQTDWQSVR